jgi:outer membrane receptor protein involved in Fe transport
VESSGGESGNNLFTRGIPADGSFRYVSVQEEGLPVFAAPECMFMNIDLLVRVDQNLDRMEGVRGGSASIFASNAAGGIINYISKTGGNRFGGSAKFSVGDYGMFRTDLEFGGPISENIRYHIGGFYRADNGIRPPNFRANEGGQIKANLTYLMKKGHFRLYSKFFQERNIFYLPIPLQGLDEELPGFDANYGTMTSQDFFYLNVRKPQGKGYQEQYLDRGMNPRLWTIGGELLYELAPNITIRDKFKRTTINHQFNAIFSLNDPMLASDYATAQGITNPVWSYTRGAGAGDPITNMANLNNNGLVVDVGWWAVTMPMNDFINDLSVNGIFGIHNVSLGYWFSHDKQEALWWWHNVLTEIKEQPRALDLQNGDTGVFYTHNGYSRYGATYLNYHFTDFVNALYANDEITLGKLTLDFGVRYEMGQIRGVSENTQSYDMGDATTLADDDVTFGDGTYEPWEFDYDEPAFSIGANYRINNNLAVFGRGSNGFRAPDDNNLVFDRAADPRVEDIWQFELGGKYNSPNVAVFGTGFYSLLNDFPFSDEVLGPGGSIINQTRFADATAIGIELELIGRYMGFGVDFTGTFQNLTYKNYQFTTGGQSFDFDGNQVRRIPKIYFTLTPSYTYKYLRVDLAIQHFGDRFTDDANTESAKLPAFTQLNAGAALNLGRYTFGVNGINLTNTIGLTEGNPRTESVLAGQKSFRMARPIMGRTIVGYFGFNF